MRPRVSSISNTVSCVSLFVLDAHFRTRLDTMYRRIHICLYMPPSCVWSYRHMHMFPYIPSSCIWSYRRIHMFPYIPSSCVWSYRRIHPFRYTSSFKHPIVSCPTAVVPYSIVSHLHVRAQCLYYSLLLI